MRVVYDFGVTTYGPCWPTTPLPSTAGPPDPAIWTDRSRSSPALIMHGGAAWNAFNAIGWICGGDWSSLKDYMHVSANGL
jgi:hypothetical protein